MHWGEATSNGAWRRAPHLELLNRKVLETIKKGGNLLVSMPPRHGKSEYLSKHTPTWYLGQHPDRHVVWLGYGANFATKYGRACRNIFRRHGHEFGLDIAKDSDSVKEWSIRDHDGSMLAVGIRGDVTGRGAHLMIIDDPYKNHIEAQSETIRQTVWDLWQSSLMTRREPGGARIIVQTRWHMDDLTGRLLAEDKDNEWESLSLPALAAENDPVGRKPGEALWPWRFDREELEKIRKGIGAYAWAALFQQTPISDGGQLFPPEYFRTAPYVPAQRPFTAVRAWDKAATEGAGDYTAGVLIVECDGYFYVADVIRGQWRPRERDEIMRQTAMDDQRRWGSVRTVVEQEGGAAGVSDAAATIRNLAGFAASTERATGEKRVRARPFASQVEAGNVYLLPGKWNREYLEELRTFPAGKHDDMVDASSLSFNHVSKGVFPEDVVRSTIDSVEKMREPSVGGVNLARRGLQNRTGVQFTR